MCGRFNFSDDQLEEIKQIIRQVNEKLYGPVTRGEVHPTQLAAVLTGDGRPEPMFWGFPRPRGPGVVINARAETVLERPLFRASVLERRCVIPSTGFYEWGEEQQSLFPRPRRAGAAGTRYAFRTPGGGPLYMAGLWQRFAAPDGTAQPRFVILTTRANTFVRDLHDRMPVVLSPAECQSWLSADVDFPRLFDREKVRLTREIA